MEFTWGFVWGDPSMNVLLHGVPALGIVALAVALVDGLRGKRVVAWQRVAAVVSALTVAPLLLVNGYYKLCSSTGCVARVNVLPMVQICVTAILLIAAFAWSRQVRRADGSSEGRSARAA